MNSKILQSIGIDIDPLFYIIGLLVICLAIFIFDIVTRHKLKVLKGRYEKFLSGKDAESLEETIIKRFEQVDTITKVCKRHNDEIKELQENMLKVYQKVGIVKYDAFNEMGGKLSFALAMLDKENTGYIINAMHSREGCYTYIKEIINGESYILLGNEEQEALDMAINTDNYME